MIKRIIVAGNSLQYAQYLRDNNFDRAESPLVMSIEKMRGYKDIPAHSVGTYYQLKDHYEMREYAFSHNMVDHEEQK